MKLDETTVIGFPTEDGWADLYQRLRKALVHGLSANYCLADREDAVEEAFHKLMHKKDPEAYGEKIPQTEADWFWQLRWQSRSFLSHMKARAERHAKYVERAAEDAFGMVAAVQGLGMDSETCRRATVRALELFREEQDVSRRDLNVYTRVESGVESVKSVCRRYGITPNNAYQIRFRVKNLLRKHGPDCFRRALRLEGSIGEPTQVPGNVV